MLDEFMVASSRHWCESCAVEALKLLPKVLYYNFLMQEYMHTSECATAVCKRTLEEKKGGERKKQKVSSKVADIEMEDLIGDKKKSNKTGNNLPLTLPYTLCGKLCRAVMGGSKTKLFVFCILMAEYLISSQLLATLVKPGVSGINYAKKLWV